MQALLSLAVVTSFVDVHGVAAAFNGAADPSMAPSTEHQRHASDTRTFLADHGLECCIDPIMRNPSFLAGGAGVDSPDDVRFLSDEQIAKLPIPEVKRTILMALASEARERRRATRAQEGRQGERVSMIFASLETMLRGFMLGAGLSFIYETLLLNRDFYQAEADLAPRVKRAAFRSLVLGGATALAMHGSAIVIPHWMRHVWLA